jgi:hypothetical protein
MEDVIDIFARLPDGTTIWIEAIRGWQKVQQRMKELRAIAPSGYFVYSEKDGIVQEENSSPINAEVLSEG